MVNYDIAVAYRIYPQVSKPAVGLPFSDDKRRMSEICLRSFKEALGDLRVKVWAILDGCPDEYVDVFRKYFDAQDLVVVRLSSAGNLTTFGKQIELLLAQNESDLVYFAEDDYVYLANEFPRMLEFLRENRDVDFVSPYDHLDCYTREIHQHPKLVRVFANHHWRTAASTCLTFLTRKQTLLRKESTFRSYCRCNFDCSLWLSLTKSSLFNPVQFLRLLFHEPLFAKIITKAWYYGWAQILFGSRMHLWVPIPGIATHLDGEALSPNIDWKVVMQEVAKRVDPLILRQ